MPITTTRPRHLEHLAAQPRRKLSARRAPCKAQHGGGFYLKGGLRPREHRGLVDHWGVGGLEGKGGFYGPSKLSTAVPGEPLRHDPEWPRKPRHERTALALALTTMSSFDLTLLYLVAAVLGVVACRFAEIAAHARLPGGWRADRPACAGVVAKFRGCTPPGRVWRGVPDVCDRAGVQPAPSCAPCASHVFGLGLLQVRADGCAMATVGSLLIWPAWLPTRLAPGAGKPRWHSRVRIAMSSTAIVVKLLAERLELESPNTANASWACCCSRTLAVVPLLVLIPALGSLARGKLFTALAVARTESLRCWSAC